MSSGGEIVNNIFERVRKFREERDWKKFHNEKDLVISINLEASELLELFQWKESKEVVEKKRVELEEELADVLIYSYMLADNLNLDINKIIDEKLEKNRKKYPIKLSKGNNKKYTDL